MQPRPIPYGDTTSAGIRMGYLWFAGRRDGWTTAASIVSGAGLEAAIASTVDGYIERKTTSTEDSNYAQRLKIREHVQ